MCGALSLNPRLLRWMGKDRRIGSWDAKVDWLVTGLKHTSGFCEVVAVVFNMMVYSFGEPEIPSYFKKEPTLVLESIEKWHCIYIY
ncbi:hypothetical protein P3S67_018203 [Capsicum chacoense]